MPTKPPLQIFGDQATMTDAAGEAEELGQEQAPVPSQEQPSGTEAPVEAPVEGQQPPEGLSPSANERFQQLVNERNELREQARQNAEYRERWARLEERQKQNKEAQTEAERLAQQQRQAQERPDPTVDPVGAELFDLRAWKQNQEQQWAQHQQQFQQLQQTIQGDRQATDFNNWVVAEAQNYARTQPDYMDAARHAAEWRINYWQELGANPEQAKQIVFNESNALAQLARQNGKSFAPLVYRLAQQLGYRPAGMNGNGNGATPAAVSAAGRTLAQVAAGQRMQGLSRAPSAGNEGATTYHAMLNLSGPALLEAQDKVSEAQWNKDWYNPQLRPVMSAIMRKIEGVTDDARIFDREDLG